MMNMLIRECRFCGGDDGLPMRKPAWAVFRESIFKHALGKARYTNEKDKYF